MIFIKVTSAFFKKKIPKMLPAITISARGRQTLKLICFLSFHVMTKLEGMPSTRSTGEIFIFALLKLNTEVNTNVFAKPHKPLM
jgi:hypothetical protein